MVRLSLFCNCLVIIVDFKDFLYKLSVGVTTGVNILFHLLVEESFVRFSLQFFNESQTGNYYSRGISKEV